MSFAAMPAATTYAAPIAHQYGVAGSMSFAAAPVASYHVHAAPAATTYAAPTSYAAPTTYVAPTTYAAPATTAMSYAAPMGMPMQQSFVMTQPPMTMTATGGQVGTHAYSDLNYAASHTDEKCADTSPMLQPNGAVHMLICGLDYSCDKVSWASHGGKKPLDHKFSFDALVEIAQLSGAQYETLWNEQCTKPNILAKIADVGRRCRAGDNFVFYFCGHGDQLQTRAGKATSGGSGMDQCLCTIDPIEHKAGTSVDGRDAAFEDMHWTRDDDLATAIIGAVNPSAKVLVLCDCCHSETICNFNARPEWAQRKQRALSVSAAADKEVALSDGMHGGIFTNSLTEAIQDLHKMPTYNVSTLFNRVHDEYAEHGNKSMPQHISIHGVTSRPMEAAWPLQARKGSGPYVAPRRRGLTGIKDASTIGTYGAPTSKSSKKKKSTKKKQAGCC
jgi:hypothetical protein